jgi:DNA primase
VLAHHQIAVEGSGLSRRARCPFHDDRVPSLAIYLNTNRYYCFGCGAKGDVINLLQRLEGISFREALQRLATISPTDPLALQTSTSWPADHGPDAQRNLELRGHSAAPGSAPAADLAGSAAEADVDDDKLVAGLLAAASALYQECLLHTPRALAYLLARGIIRSTAIETRLGFSDGTTLRRYIGHDPALVRCATRVGLLDGWGHERLRERLVMPAFRGGRCIWMIGRLLRDGDEQEAESGARSRSRPPASSPRELNDAADGTGRRARPPRYLGLTLRKPLLGLDLVPDHVWLAGALRGVLVVEGIFDLLTVRAWRLPIACVALVGTHLRHDQLQDLLTLAHGGPIWLGLDADVAGEQAAERLKDQLVTAGCPTDAIRRLRAPSGAKDLSDVVHDAHARTAILAALAEDTGPDGLVLGHQASTASDAGPTRQSMRSPHVRGLARPVGGDDDECLD